MAKKYLIVEGVVFILILLCIFIGIMYYPYKNNSKNKAISFDIVYTYSKLENDEVVLSLPSYLYKNTYKLVKETFQVPDTYSELCEGIELFLKDENDEVFTLKDDEYTIDIKINDDKDFINIYQVVDNTYEKLEHEIIDNSYVRVRVKNFYKFILEYKEKNNTDILSSDNKKVKISNKKNDFNYFFTVSLISLVLIESCVKLNQYKKELKKKKKRKKTS